MIAMSKEQASPLVTAEGKPITRAYVGASWQAGGAGERKGLESLIRRKVGADADLWALLLDGDDECIRLAEGRLKDPFGNGEVLHSGDDRKGSADNADNESISIDLDRLPTVVAHVVFTLSTYAKRSNFGQISTVTTTIRDRDTGDSVRLYPPVNASHPAILVARFSRVGDGWTVRELGTRVSARNRDQLIVAARDAVRAQG